MMQSSLIIYRDNALVHCTVIIESVFTVIVTLQKLLSGHKNAITYLGCTINQINPDIYEALILMEYCRGKLKLYLLTVQAACVHTG